METTERLTGSRDPSPLLQPLSLGSLTVANRFVMSPMTRASSPHGVPGANVAEYYRKRANGGVGLIITEGTGIDHPAAIGYSDFNGGDIPMMYGEAALAGWREVVKAVHAEGGKIAPQLWHQGPMRLVGCAPFPDHPSSRPSGIWGEKTGRSTIAPEAAEKLLPECAPLTESEIGDIIAGYARSAAIAKDLGFDAIALHGGHGYLIDSFFWSVTNRRTDRYGGDHARRARFAAEVVKAVRATIGEQMPIFLRFSQWKQQDLGAKIAETPEQLEQLLGPIADAGVDVFDASTRKFGTPEFDGSPLNLAGWARKLTGKLSMTVGGVGMSNDLYTAYAEGGSRPASLDPLIERFEQSEFDLVAVGRALIADHDWVQRIQRGEPTTRFEGSMVASLN